MCIKHFYMCSDWGPLILQSGWSVYTKTLISLKTEIESERCKPSFCSYSWCLNRLNVIGYTWPPSLYKTFSTWWPTGDQLKYCIKQYHNNNFSLFCAVPLEPFMLTAPLSTYHHMSCDSKNLKYFFFLPVHPQVFSENRHHGNQNSWWVHSHVIDQQWGLCTHTVHRE